MIMGPRFVGERHHLPAVTVNRVWPVHASWQ